MSLNLVLLADENGAETPTYNEKGEVFMHNVEDNSYIYVPLSKELLDAYPQLQIVSEPVGMDITNEDDCKQKTYWTYSATIMLINKYKAYYPLFADSLHKNTEVWDKIAEEFRHDGYSFCGTKCENRWKYIRAKYIKKKDNAGPGSTGSDIYMFEYYNEIDEILGKKPNVVPKYLASSEKQGHSKGTGNAKSSRTSSSANKSLSSSRLNSTKTTSTVTAFSTSISTSSGHNVPNPAQIDLTSDPVGTTGSGTSVQHSNTHPTNATTGSRRSRRRLSYEDTGDCTGVQAFFNDVENDEEEAPPSTPAENKGKRRKEPWEENVERQDRYHADMMAIQRESLDMFSNYMSQMIDCFRKN